MVLLLLDEQSSALPSCMHTTQKSRGGHFVYPISDLSGHLAAIIFVVDTDILHLDLRKDETVSEAHEALQISVHN